MVVEKWLKIGQNAEKVVKNCFKRIKNYPKTGSEGQKLAKIIKNGKNRQKWSKVVENSQKLVGLLVEHG
jgi:hypothetical protein